MKKLAVIFLTAAALAIPAAAQPVIANNGIVNAASYANPQLPNGSIAQGSFFIIFGNNLGPAALAQAQSLPLPTELAGTSVKVTAGGNSLDCPVFYTSAGQVAAILPSTTPLGQANITLTFSGQTSAARQIQVVASSFGIYAVNSRGTGPGIVTNSNYQLFTPTFAAQEGDAVIVWGDGLGATTGSDADAPKQVDLTNVPAEVYIGGKKATRLYAGRAPYPAEDQINVLVPAGVSPGCNVSVTVKINNIASNTTTMPIAAAGQNRVCSDANGFSASDLESIFTKSTYSLGNISLSRSAINLTLPPPLPSQKNTTDSGSASFGTFTPGGVSSGASFLGIASLNSCIVFTSSSASGGAVTPGTFTGLDAGTAINVKGPNGQKQMPATAGFKGSYGATFATSPAPLYLDAGSYSIDNGPGGADVKGFSFNMDFPQPLTWNELNTISNTPIIRANGVTVTWTGGAPGTFAQITGTSVTSGQPAIAVIFICQAPVEARTFFVGPEILLQLPPSGNTQGIPLGFLGVGNSSNPVRFTAPGLDLGLASASSSNTAGATYQ